MAIKTAELGGVRLTLEDNLQMTVTARGTVWRCVPEDRPRLETRDGSTVYFSDAAQIVHSLWETGVGRGIHSTYGGFPGLDLAFETVVWIEGATEQVYFEFIPLTDRDIQAVFWPGAFQFEEKSNRWYSVLNVLQGLLLPNTWQTEVRKLPFEGQLCSCAAYMPWFGQIRDRTGYMAICQTPWDGAYQVDHPADGPYTHLSWRWLPSLGRLDYRRVLRYSFLADCDYNDLCKVYRAYARETGLLTTLEEKAARNPLVNKLIGAAIVHKGIKTHVAPGSYYYDPDHPEKNDHLTTFAQRQREIRRYREKGVEKLYLHLDGWGDPGYDNHHPDYLPACKAAGGWEGLKALSDTLEACGYLFGLHDQYRDYYFDAPTFDREFACLRPDGTIFEQNRWAGGRQTYLCASQAPYYVKRNFEEVLRHGVHLEASYLDVFTCNEPDECANPRHRMTRRECLGYRKACFDYLWSKGILPSSEEVTDWAMESLVFAHYGPYEFMLQKPGSPRNGIPTPLYNLVYHDCMILPWLMDRLEGREDYLLYALLNGGAAYLDKDGAYPGCDGAFEGAEQRLDQEIARYRLVAALQERVAKCEMVRHRFLDGDWQRQQTTFSDGTTVTVNFRDGSYRITP